MLTNILLAILIVLGSVLLILEFKKEEESMSVAYVSLICAGKKTFKQVPARLKDEVKQMLIALDLEYLVEEE